MFSVPDPELLVRTNDHTSQPMLPRWSCHVAPSIVTVAITPPIGAAPPVELTQIMSSSLGFSNSGLLCVCIQMS